MTLTLGEFVPVCKSSVKKKQNVTIDAFKTPLKAKLKICIYKTSFSHRPDELWFHTKLPGHILQRNCAHVY